MNITKAALKRPIAVVICIMALLIFGLSSIFSMPVELTPPMELPILLISTSYPGAGPEEVADLVTQKVEAAVSTVAGLETIQSVSQENMSMVQLQLVYGTNLTTARMDVQKKLDMYVNSLPEEASAPVIIEMDMNMMATISLSAQGTTDKNTLYFVKEEIVPEFEKLSGVASVEVYGGHEDYIRIELIPERLAQYGLDMTTLANTISNADFSLPAGTIDRGNQQLILRGGVNYNSTQSLKDIPISLRSGDIIHLSDVANVYETAASEESTSRYNGEESITINVLKRQSASTLEVTGSVVKTMDRLNLQDIGVELSVISNSGEEIISAIKSVGSALLLGAIISIVVLYFFLGDIKASLIVATSMPLSVLATLVAMSLTNISINMVSLGGLVVGVGMMVDNSIVVLDSCFRFRDKRRSFRESALEGAKLVATSVSASTLTTIVVFLPISVMDGLSGQLFAHAGYTIMFSLIASLVSALTLVPMLFCKFEPAEKKKSFVSKGIRKVEHGYGVLIQASFRHKILVVVIAIVLLVGSVAMIPMIGMELMPAMDQGSISVNITTRPGLKLSQVDSIVQQVEDFVPSLPDVETYSANASPGGGSVSIYLKDNRTVPTNEVADMLRAKTKDILDCEIKVSAVSGMSFGGSSEAAAYITGKDLDQLELAANQISEMMYTYDDVVNVSSSISDGNPQAEILVDPIKAASVGLTPAQVVSSISTIMRGREVNTIRQNGQDFSVRVEYPQGRYEAISDLQGVTLVSPTGRSVPLFDVASIEYSNSPQAVQRYNNEYFVSVTAQIGGNNGAKTATNISRSISQIVLPEGVHQFMGGSMDMMNNEFNALFGALATAIILVFMVMAVQFNSMRNSIIVMLSVPFSMIGAFFGLLITGFSISMTSLIGIIELVGIVVNNAIVLIDYTNQLRNEGMEVREALCLAGQTRLRPILMTTLTTCLSLLPMGLGIGQGTELLQSMSIVVIGGLTSSTVLTLVLIPVFYLLFDKKPKKDKPDKRKKMLKEIDSFSDEELEMIVLPQI